jgi:hypothetical protein
MEGFIYSGINLSIPEHGAGLPHFWILTIKPLKQTPVEDAFCYLVALQFGYEFTIYAFTGLCKLR